MSKADTDSNATEIREPLSFCACQKCALSVSKNTIIKITGKVRS